jgi:hypothetical protein
VRRLLALFFFFFFFLVVAAVGARAAVAMAEPSRSTTIYSYDAISQSIPTHRAAGPTRSPSARPAGTTASDHEQTVSTPTALVVAAESGLPELTIEDSQFGQKIGQHARDFGLDPADQEARAFLRGRIEDIRTNFDEVRQGPWNPKGGGGSDYLFFRQGSDVVVARGDGSFVTILRGGEANGWYRGSTPR